MANERIQATRAYIDQQGEVTLTELQDLYQGLSNMTLWRDLKQLEDQGAILRTHGGAVSMRRAPTDIEGVYHKRARENVREKRRIAQAALPFVCPGRAIYLDAGSTVMGVAAAMEDERYTIITSGANIAIELSQKHSCNAMLVGGQFSETTLSCSGPLAEQFINGVNIDLAIMATSGFSLTAGFTSGSLSEATLKQKVIEKTAKTVMLMDGSKTGRSLPFTFAALEQIDVLITDSLPDEPLQHALSLAGVELILA